MSAIKMQIKNKALSTPLPNIFIDDFMPKAPATYSIVYILAMRHCFHGENSISIADIAKNLSLLESDVINAWRYWEKEGLVKILDDSIENFSIEFCEIDKKENASKPKKDEPKIKIRLASQPSYSPQEIDIYMERSSEIRDLFKTAENIFAKPLTYSELNMILSFFEWYSLPIDVIEVMLEYCISNNKKGKNYLEKVAMDWSDNGIDTVEAANNYIDTFNIYNKILKSFGITGKTPNKKQTAFMKKWLDEYGLSFEVISEACETTFLQTGKSSFEYADKILTEWHEKGVRTLEDINEDKQRFNENKKDKNPENSRQLKTPAYKNRFINYEQREWNYDEIERLEMENSK